MTPEPTEDSAEAASGRAIGARPLLAAGARWLRRRLRGAPAPAPLEWVERAADVPVLAVVAPGWFGVTTSARDNFPNVLLCPEHGARPGEVANRILGRGYTTVVFYDLPDTFGRVARRLRERAPSARLLVHYHGSFTQNAQQPIRERLRDVVQAVRAGVIERVGCVKADMAEVLQRFGVEACYVPNRVEPPAQAAVGPARSPRRIGVFARGILRKNSHAQLVAALLVRDAEVHAMEAHDLSYLPEPQPVVVHGELPHEEFLSLLGQMDVNLYVSLSECYPMVVVESLVRGVPCVTSHTHEILRYDAELAERLLVDALDNPLAIAERTEAVLAEREALGPRCVAYARELNERAEAALNSFVGLDLYQVRGGRAGQA